MPTITYNNNNNFTAPANDFVLVEAWGAGGGGGSTSLTTTAGGGGGGGAYARAYVQVVQGRAYRVISPPGGANGANNANGAAGGVADFGWNNAAKVAMYVRAAGGGAGTRAVTRGVGAAITSCFTLDGIAFAGGAGANGVNATGQGGGGGAGAGNANAGAAATNGGGAAGANGGGNGGAGGASGVNGTAGVEPGGGGGGGGNRVSANMYGGAGGRGRVTVTYNDAVTVSGKVTNGGANQEGARVIVIGSDNNAAGNAFIVGVFTSNATGNWAGTAPDNRTIWGLAQFNNANLYIGNAHGFIAL